MGSWRDWRGRTKQFLDTHGIRQADIAAAMGVSRGAVGHWLSGKNEINLSDFFRLCEAVGADPGQLLFGQSHFASEISAASYAQHALNTSAPHKEQYAAWQKRMRAFKSRARKARMR